MIFINFIFIHSTGAKESCQDFFLFAVLLRVTVDMMIDTTLKSVIYIDKPVSLAS